jgi:hypothetical protein
LRGAIEADQKGFGEQTKRCMKNIGKVGVKAGEAIEQDIVKNLLLQYFGLK